MKPLRFLAIAIILLIVAAPKVFAHAYPNHADPAINGTVSPAPTELRIWFTQKIEPAFSKVEVHDASGVQVDKGDAQVDKADPTLLRVSLKPLPPGTYKVAWHVVSVDTHATQGDFTFTVK